MKLFPTSFLLGLAGIDPTGAIVIVTALTLGIKKKSIVIFALTVFICTILVGLFASDFIVVTSVNFIANLFNYIPDYIYMILMFVVGLILIKWFIERTFFEYKKINREKKKESIFSRYIKKVFFCRNVIFCNCGT